MARTQKTIDSWDNGVDEMVKTNLQALQRNTVNSFDSLPDWSNHGKVTDKQLKGRRLTDARQLTIKDSDSYRVVYIAEYVDKIVVLHAFKKKTEGVDSKAMTTVKERLSRIKRDIKDGLI